MSNQVAKSDSAGTEIKEAEAEATIPGFSEKSEDEIKSEFKIGRKVKCVNGDFNWGPDVPDSFKNMKKPQKGHAYTIRELIEHPKKCWGILVKELKNEIHEYPIGGSGEPMFSIDRFIIDDNLETNELLGDMKNASI